MYKKHITVLSMLAGITIAAAAQTDSLSNKEFSQPAYIGGDKAFALSETTGAVSVIGSDQINRRSAKNIGNDIIGLGSGLQSLQGAGRYADQNPTFYVRGLQTLNGNNAPLTLVDGVERDINTISADEVESVEILKDAAAVALYGVKGVNGVISVTTKRGKKNSREITFTYDHVFDYIAHRPKMVDGYTYGLAINEGRLNDGLGVMYQDWELNALRDQTYPLLYPNVNWLDETFRNKGAGNKYVIQFRGGSEKFRYYAMANLITDNGFIKRPNETKGYSTQDKFSRGNVRMNLDIDLTPTTLVKVNVFGTLSESQMPGDQANLWDMIYTVPSAAFPIKAESGLWGGSNTWAGTLNPVGQAQGAAYYKNHVRGLFTDLTLRQDLSGLTQGLSAQVRVSYDNMAQIYENHSKTYQYDVVTPNWPEGAAAPSFSSDIQGTDSEMGTGSGTNWWTRMLHVDAGVNYDRTFGDWGVYSQLKWDYDYTDPNGINNTVYRQNISWWSHVSYKNRYIADLTLVESGSSRLAPGTKWAFSPTLGLAWVISNESFWTNPESYLKIRGSVGKINTDFLPGDNVWTYYQQQYQTSGVTYPWNSSWSSPYGQTSLGQMATPHPGREKAYKYNLGIDASPIKGLNLTLDLYKERRSGIWVSSAGKYTSLIGLEAPYENGGIVDSKGLEFTADYGRTFGDWSFDIAGSFSYNKNKIIDMLEEPRLYPNLVQTGHRVDQLYGLEAIGFFQNEAEIANSPTQAFSTVKVGDIKYRDVNGDGIIDSNDKVAIGYTTTCPEIYYNFRLGAEYKGIGLYAVFQGTGNYTAVLNTKGMYWPLVSNTNISQYAYDNRWTPENPNALFPRLSSQSNANNYQTSTLWMRDRSFLKLRNIEVYYNIPSAFLQNTIGFVNAAKVYVRGTDLFSTSNVPENDPECYGVQPVNRRVAFGLSVTF